jgi:hypothetical protein
MDASNLSLLVAITVPVAALAALHVWLALNGERGTLLLPAIGEFNLRTCPACVLGAMVKSAASARLARIPRALEAANDESFREVA